MKIVSASVYLHTDDQVLFLVRNKKGDLHHQQGIYLPIGGKVDAGESIEDCAKREVLEESGIKVNSVKLKGMMYVTGQGEGKDDWTIFLFTSDDFEGEPQAGNEGHFEWIDMDKIGNLNIYEGDRLYMNWLFKKNFFALELVYKGFEYVSHKILAVV